MKKKQDNETKVYLVYDEELDQFVLKKGDDCTILEVLDLKDPGTEEHLEYISSLGPDGKFLIRSR